VTLHKADKSIQIVAVSLYGEAGDAFLNGKKIQVLINQIIHGKASPQFAKRGRDRQIINLSPFNCGK
jgi:hypothetical protein